MSFDGLIWMLLVDFCQSGAVMEKSRKRKLAAVQVLATAVQEIAFDDAEPHQTRILISSSTSRPMLGKE